MKSNLRDPNSRIEKGFHDKVDLWVSELFRRNIVDFSELLLALPGVYPSEVLASIRRLEILGEIPIRHYREARRSVAFPRIRTTPLVALPKKTLLEHPLDFEWRFTRIGVARICDEIKSLHLRKGAHILCLGCPSVYLIGKALIPQFTFELWDKNAEEIGQLAEAGELRSFDLAHAGRPSAEADVAVVDPPWYNEFYRVFMWAAMHSLPIGGRIFVSFPPAGTRPSAVRDLEEFGEWCIRAGIRLEQRMESYLPYRSPLFEVNALKTEGIGNFPLNWRRGDLLIFVKERLTKTRRPTIAAIDDNWKEVRVGSARVRIRFGKNSEGIDLVPVGKTEILPSVSSKHKLRPLANVVTSGNRFLETGAPERLFQHLAEIESAQRGGNAPERLRGKRPPLFTRAFELVCKEEQEATDYYSHI